MAHTWNSPDGADAVVPETDRTSRIKAMYWLPLSSHWRPTRNEVASWKPEVVTWSSRQVAIVEYHVTGNAGTAALHFSSRRERRGAPLRKPFSGRGEETWESQL
jgi:hypothetical protein